MTLSPTNNAPAAAVDYMTADGTALAKGGVALAGHCIDFSRTSSGSMLTVLF